MPATLAKSWSLPAAVSKEALCASLLKSLLDAVDELARCQRAFNNARQAIAIAHKHGAAMVPYMDEVARCEVELSVAVTLVVYQRGLYQEGMSQVVESMPYTVGA